jgi:hypothetical protein
VSAISRERARELERRSRQLPSPSRRRTSGTMVSRYWPLLTTPPVNAGSQHSQLELPPGPALQSEGSNLGPSRWRTSGTTITRYPPLLPTPPATARSQYTRLEPPPGSAVRSEPGLSVHSIAQRARRESERQQRLQSVDGNVPPLTPPPSNGRTRPDEHLTMDPYPQSLLTDCLFRIIVFCRTNTLPRTD